MAALEPRHLPRTVDDLEQWRVWADALIATGDRLGPLIAMDLALGRSPEPGQLQAYWDYCRRRCRPFRHFRVAWCLGFARRLHVVPDEGRGFARAWWRVSSAEQLKAVSEFLQTSRGSRTELLELWISPPVLQTPELRALMRVLPATCETLRLHAFTFPDAESTKPLFALLPRTVRRLSLSGTHETQAESFLGHSDIELDLRGWSSGEAPDVPGVVSGWVRDARSVSQLKVGCPGDAALFAVKTRTVTVIPPAPLIQLQHRHDLISAVAQIERLIPEGFSLGVAQDRLRVGSGRGSHLLRHGAGQWTATTWAPSPESNIEIRITVEGKPVEPDTVVPLADGCELTVNEEEYRFFADVAGQRWKQRF
jgi:hypothetical protein